MPHPKFNLQWHNSLQRNLPNFLVLYIHEYMSITHTHEITFNTYSHESQTIYNIFIYIPLSHIHAVKSLNSGKDNPILFSSWICLNAQRNFSILERNSAIEYIAAAISSSSTVKPTKTLLLVLNFFNVGKLAEFERVNWNRNAVVNNRFLRDIHRYVLHVK